MEIERKEMMLTFFGSTDEKYVLIDGDLEASVRVNGQGLFRLGDEESGLYLNFKFHQSQRVWGAEIVPATNFCDIHVGISIESGSLVAEVECDPSCPIYAWDPEQKAWCRIEGDLSTFASLEF